MSTLSAVRTSIGILVAMILMSAPLTATAAPSQPPHAQPGVIGLAGTPHLFFSDAAGLLRWGGDTRALAGRRISWSNRIDVSGDQFCTLPAGNIGDPWLSTGLLKDGDPIYLVKWETGWLLPKLLHIQSIRDVEVFGINERNYGNFVLDVATWEARYGLSVAGLQRGVLEPVCASPVAGQPAQAAGGVAVQATGMATGTPGQAHTETGTAGQTGTGTGTPGQAHANTGTADRTGTGTGTPGQAHTETGTAGQANANTGTAGQASTGTGTSGQANTGTSTSPAQPTTPPPTRWYSDNKKSDARVLEAVREVLAGRLGVSAERLQVESAEQGSWSNTSLGCPKPGEVYAQVLTPGNRVVLSYNDQSYTYHTNANARQIQIVTC